MMKMPNWAREPLLHFLVLGAALYVVLTWGGSPPDPSSRVISVGASEKQKIAESWALTMGRLPTDAELDQAVETFVREEVLYREALRLGLSEDDAVVRRRLVSKMDLSASLAAEVAEPSDEILRTYLKDNMDRYAGEESERFNVSIDQALFTTQARAQSALASGAIEGEATSLPASVNSVSERELEARFGQKFVQGLALLDPEEGWQGPIRSGFGWHLVRLRERAAVAPDFETLRLTLTNDWRNAQIKARKERAYETLVSAYRVDID